MMRHSHTAAQHSRRDARARVRTQQLVAAVAQVDASNLLGTIFTKKINPCWASGGHPMEGDS